jgi:hypothetical protein
MGNRSMKRTHFAAIFALAFCILAGGTAGRGP